jgi:hypothetical protein
MAMALFAIAGVLGMKYYKVAEYACYYVTAPPSTFEGRASPTASYAPQVIMDANGEWVNTEGRPVCYLLGEGEEFVCPSKYGGMVYLGNTFATRAAIRPYLV